MSVPAPESRAAPVSPWGCLLVLAALLILTPTLGVWVYLRQGAARVQKMLDAVRAEGEPADAGALEAFYALPLGTPDATPLWLAAITPLGSPAYAKSAGDLPVVGSSEEKIPPPGQPWEQQAAAEQHLKDYSDVLARLHQAAETEGGARYPTDFHKGLTMPLPHAQSLRDAARLLDLEARVRARQGDARGAAQAVHAIFRAAHSLEREPILISQLVRYACVGVGINTLNDLLPHVEFSDADLARLQADLEAPDYRASLQRSLLGERVLGVTAFQDPAGLNREVSVLAIKATALTRRADMALYLDTMDKFHAAAGKPWATMQPEAQLVQQQLEDDVNSSPVNRARYALTAMLMPAMEVSFTATARTHAHSQVAATALAAERYRQQHGAWPADLESLVPEFLPAVPRDPFDGQPLRRRVTGEQGFKVYSVGANGIDDGGQEAERRGEPDITFSLQR